MIVLGMHPFSGTVTRDLRAVVQYVHIDYIPLMQVYATLQLIQESRVQRTLQKLGAEVRAILATEKISHCILS